MTTNYMIAVVEGLVFDTEPNDGMSDSLRSLDGVSGAVGSTSSDGDPSGDWYTITALAGQVLGFRTAEPFDNPSGAPANDLDSRLALYDPSGVLVVTSQDTAPDGKNAVVTHVAEQDGGHV